MAIVPTKEQFSEFAQGERDGEVVMINLLHFSAADASGSDDAAGPTGKAAYRDYGDQVIKMVESRGGHVVWMGRPEHVLIGDPDSDGWDLAVLVSYPSRSAFLDMVTSPNYNEAHKDRERGLDRTVLLACEPLPVRAASDG